MPQITDLQELLKHELKDLYSAEVQLIDALPKMADKATNPELKKAFRDHLKVTQEHRSRLDKIQKFFNMETKEETRGFFANLFGSKEGEEHCKAMEGLVKEASSLMDEDMTPEVMDAALIAAAQKVEHYEISSYGTARAFASQLGFRKVIDLLSATLAEEYAADDSLTTLALGKVNLDAGAGNGNNGQDGSGGNEDDEEEDSASPAKKKSGSSAKSSGKGSSSKGTAKKTAAKKAPAKKQAAKSSPAKKSSAKKSSGSSAKKSSAKKSARKR